MNNIEVNKEKSVIYVVCKGMIARPEALEILQKLKDTFGSLNTASYNLIIDSKEVKTTPADAVDVLQSVMEIYIVTKFKNKFFVVPESAITNMQNKRADSNNFMGQVILVKSYEDAIAKI